MAMFPQLPQVPQRPSLDEWRRSSEREKLRYDTALEAYLLMACDAQTYATLYAMRDFAYAWYHSRDELDPNWKRGGAGVRDDC